jgi:hypothetical protein
VTIFIDNIPDPSYANSIKSLLTLCFHDGIVDVNSALMSLHHVDVDSVVDISEVHTASISRAEVCRVDKFQPWKSKMACTSKISATLPTSIGCKHPRAKSTKCTRPPSGENVFIIVNV